MAIHWVFKKNHIVYVWVQYCISYTVNITVYNIIIYIWRRLLDDLLATFSLSTHFSLLLWMRLVSSEHIASSVDILLIFQACYTVNATFIVRMYTYNVSFFFWTLNTNIYIVNLYVIRKNSHFSLQSGIFLIMIYIYYIIKTS